MGRPLRTWCSWASRTHSDRMTGESASDVMCRPLPGAEFLSLLFLTASCVSAGGPLCECELGLPSSDSNEWQRVWCRSFECRALMTACVRSDRA